MADRMRHLAGAMIGAVVVALLAAGCTPEPAPSPSPTGFASEEEAFAAAEATYRAYVDALNQVDLSDPATFEAVYALTNGDANTAARKEFSQMHADRWVVGGATIPTLIEVEVGSTIAQASLAVCADVASVTLVDPAGNSVVSPDRPDIQAQRVSLNTSAGEWRITSISGREGDPTCD